MILAGDIGGTNARLAVLEENGAQFNIVNEHDYPSHDYKSLEDIVADFVKERQCIVEHACFAVAGPVIRGKCVATNLPWSIEAAKLAAVLGKKRISLINDLEALAYGLTTLPETDLVTLQKGAENAYGNYAVIAAGTGLGEGGLLWSGARTFPITSEGGHSSFAPRNGLEIELFRYLSERFGGHVSCERILSGPGLRNVYDFFSINSGVDGKLKELASHKKEIIEAKDTSAEISITVATDISTSLYSTPPLTCTHTMMTGHRHAEQHTFRAHSCWRDRESTRDQRTGTKPVSQVGRGRR